MSWPSCAQGVLESSCAGSAPCKGTLCIAGLGELDIFLTRFSSDSRIPFLQKPPLLGQKTPEEAVLTAELRDFGGLVPCSCWCPASAWCARTCPDVHDGTPCPPSAFPPVSGPPSYLPAHLQPTPRLRCHLIFYPSFLARLSFVCVRAHLSVLCFFLSTMAVWVYSVLLLLLLPPPTFSSQPLLLLCADV